MDDVEDGGTEGARPPGVDPDGVGPDGVDPVGVVPVDLRDWVRFDAGAATRVRVLATERLALDLWCIEPQQATDVLTVAEADVVYTVLGGRSWFATDDGEVGLDPLGSVLVPAGTVHGIANRAPDPLIVLAVSSPPGQAPALAAPAAADGRAVRADGRSGVRALLTRRRR